MEALLAKLKVHNCVHLAVQDESGVGNSIRDVLLVHLSNNEK